MKVYVDMDGVLCNFDKEVKKIHPSWDRNHLLTREEKIALFKTFPQDFFYTLEKTPIADGLIEFLSNTFGTYSICSSPLRGRWEETIHHKKMWLKDNLSIQPSEIHIIPNKEKLANEHSILIDDRLSILDRWKNAGGVPILFNGMLMPLSKLKRDIDAALGKVYC